MASRFASHLRLWLVVSPILLAVLPPFLPDDATFAVSQPEEQSVSAAFGTEHAIAIAERANRRFDAWFVASGAMRSTLAGTSSQTMITDGGAESKSLAWIKHFWMAIYRAVYRAAVVGAMSLGAVVFILAMLNDGIVRSKIRAAAAGFASPVAFHVAAHASVVVIGADTCALLLPLPFPAQWWSLGILVMGLLGWRMAASFHVGK